MGSRLNGAFISVGGFIIAVVGLGMYKSPELNWMSFSTAVKEVFTTLIDRLIHFTQDPFALIGCILLVIGLILIGKGTMMFISGTK